MEIPHIPDPKDLPLDERVRLAYNESLRFARLRGKADPDEMTPLFERYGLLTDEGTKGFVEFSRQQALDLKKGKRVMLTTWDYLTKVLPGVMQTENFKKDPMWFIREIALRIIQK